MIARADGRLRHCFFGEYSAVIALGFDSEAQAAAALPQLGAGWKAGTKPKALIWRGEREALEICKARLVSFGADGDAIDSIAHSIDYGDRFSVEIEVTDPRQIPLFEAAP